MIEAVSSGILEDAKQQEELLEKALYRCVQPCDNFCCTTQATSNAPQSRRPCCDTDVNCCMPPFMTYRFLNQRYRVAAASLRGSNLGTPCMIACQERAPAQHNVRRL